MPRGEAEPNYDVCGGKGSGVGSVRYGSVVTMLDTDTWRSVANHVRRAWPSNNQTQMRGTPSAWTGLRPRLARGASTRHHRCQLLLLL